MSTCYVHCQAFHYDVAIASVRRIGPEPQTALEPGEAPEQLPGPPPIPPRPAKLLTSEMSRSVCAPRYWQAINATLQNCLDIARE